MANRHIIGTLRVEVVARPSADRSALTDWVLAEELWRDLSAVFDQLVPGHEVVTIPQLELTVQAHSAATLRAALTEAFRDAIGQIVRTRDGQRARFLSIDQHGRYRVQYFLETGRLFWSTSSTGPDSIADWFRQLPDAPDAEFVAYLRNRGPAEPTIWLRFTHALGFEKLNRFVLNQLNLSAEQTQWLLDQLDRHFSRTPFSAQALFWQTLFLHAPRIQADPAALTKLVQTTLGTVFEPGHPFSAHPPAQSTEAVSGRSASDAPDTGTVFGSADEVALPVSNAGLVLLGPFIPMLFRGLELVVGADFRDDEARCRGIHLLQYLVTSETDTWEYDLPLNKVLCGWNMDQPVPRTAHLTEQDYEGAGKLLQHVLAQWPVIRSIEALRVSFLQRKGLLTPSGEGGWKLDVERKTLDILLTRPPKRPTDGAVGLRDQTAYPTEWGFSVLKFPWMPTMLTVTW